MKFIKIILVLCLLSVNLYSFEFIRDKNKVFDKHQLMMDMELVGDNLFILTRKSIDKTSKKDIAGMFKMNLSGDFQEIEMTYNQDTAEQQIYVKGWSKIVKNANGDLFLINNAIYKFSNNQWTKFDFDIFNDNSTVSDITFDKNGNMWFVCLEMMIGSYKGGLYKYDGSNLIEVYNGYFDNGFVNGKSNLIALNNGNIALQRKYDKTELDFSKYEANDLWVFNQDGELVNTALIHLSAELPKGLWNNKDGVNEFYGNKVNKSVSQIFENSEGNLYISTVNKVILKQDSIGIINYGCCQGLSKYNLQDDIWRVYKAIDGLAEKKNPFNEQYQSVYAITELSDGRILFTGERGIYLINNDDKIVKVDSKVILDNAKFIVQRDDIYEDEVFGFRIGTLFGDEYEKYSTISSLLLGFHDIQKASNGDIFFFYTHGILTINENIFLVSDVQDSEAHILLYPNPSNDKIIIKGIDKNSNYKIINILGEEVVQGVYTESIDISNLSIGQYFIQINNVNGINNLKFIKD